MRPPLPIFWGGRGGKNIRGGSKDLFLLILFQINAYLGFVWQLRHFLVFHWTLPLKAGTSDCYQVKCHGMMFYVCRIDQIQRVFKVALNWSKRS